MADDVFAAADRMVGVARTIEPNPANAAVYHDKYRLYKTLLAEMQSPWKYYSQHTTH